MKQKSVAAILSEMSSEKLIDKALVQSWRDLRNTLAHADNEVSAAGNFEKFVNDLHNCLTLFSKLIDLCITNASNDSLIAGSPVDSRSDAVSNPPAQSKPTKPA